MSTTAGNGPAPSGRSSSARTRTGAPGVTLSKETRPVAQPASTSAAKTIRPWRRMRRAYTDIFGYRITHGLRRAARRLQRLSLTLVLPGGGPPPATSRGARPLARDRASRLSAASDACAAGPLQGNVSRGGMAALRRDVRGRRHLVHAVAARDDAELEPARARGGQVCGATG